MTEAEKDGKTINIALDYRLEYPDGHFPENPSKEAAELSKGYIEYAVTAHFKDGLGRKQRRTYARIQSKICDSIASGSYLVGLSQEELEMLSSAFSSENVKFTAALSKYVVVLEEEILG